MWRGQGCSTQLTAAAGKSSLSPIELTRGNTESITVNSAVMTFMPPATLVMSSRHFSQHEHARCYFRHGW